MSENVTSSYGFLFSEIREMFSLFDTNHDGRITAEELGIVLERLGYIISSESLKALVNEIDYDGE